MKFLMKILTNLWIIIVLLIQSSCVQFIDMSHSQTYNFEGANLTMAVPNGWHVGVSYDKKHLYVTSVVITNKDYIDKITDDLIYFIIMRPKNPSSNFLPQFNDKICREYGNYYFYIANSAINDRPICGLYINKDLSFGMYFRYFPKYEVTPELEAVFKSMKVIITTSK